MQRIIQSATLLVLAILMPLGHAAQTLDAEQVRQLFSDKTVEYSHAMLNFDFIIYHAPDGSLRGTRNGEPMSEMQWSVNPDGKLCIAYDQHQRCHPIMRDEGVYKKYKTTANGETKILVTYRRFIDGNPNHF